ncbi:MAG: SDR family oxidoreductase [Beggiatoa sp.]|nr:SDR family oxidoreductase [Beggiatoa sp.]
MKAAGSGVILNMSWDLALSGMAGRNPEMFAAVKAGVLGFSKCLARSYAPEVRVNELAPGWIRTAFADEAMAHEAQEAVIADTPLRRFGAPEDVAHAALYLCSDEAAFITGQTLRVNGGLSS